MASNNDYKARNYVGTGDDIRAVARSSRINGLQDMAQSQVRGDPYSRSGSTYRMIGPGWVINRQRRGLFVKGTGAQINDFPWRIRVVTDANNNTAIKISPGTINNIIPSNMFDTFPISPIGMTYVYLNVITDGFGLTGVQINIASAPPPPNPWSVEVPPTSFTALLGMLINTAVYQFRSSIFFTQPIATVQISRDNPVPGKPLTTGVYTWSGF